MLSEIRTKLIELSRGNEEYAEFDKKIVKTKQRVVGVRIPILRKLAKELARNTSYEKILKLLNSLDTEVYEETLLAGLMINYARLTDDEKLDLSERFLQLADSWAHIDVFVEKQRKKYDREFWWNYSLKCLGSKNEFTVRYGVINLMSNYLDDEYIERTFAELRKIKHDGYYVKMGLAWLYATAAINNFDRVIDELARDGTDSWTRKKSYQKMIESYRITDEQKSKIRALRAKILE